MTNAVFGFIRACTDPLGSSGCAICGDDDQFSPSIEAFELTGKMICAECFDGTEENQND